MSRMGSAFSDANSVLHELGLPLISGDSLWHAGPEFLHSGAATAGSLYRILIRTGQLWTAVSGSMTFFKIMARSKKGQSVFLD